jgi:hypothetical protein
MLLKRFFCIGRTGGSIPTGIRQKRGNHPLIDTYQDQKKENKNPLDHPV